MAFLLTLRLGTGTSQYGHVVDWLIRAGIVNKCMKCSQEFYPGIAYQDVNAFNYIIVIWALCPPDQTEDLLALYLEFGGKYVYE